MKTCLTIKCKLFFSITAILACSYVILFLLSLSSIQRFIEDETAKNLDFSLRFAKSQFNARPELALEALKLPASTPAVQKLFLNGDKKALQEAASLWIKSIGFFEMLTIVDASQNIIARSHGNRDAESFIKRDLLESLVDRKQPVITTELIPHNEYCAEVSNEVCQALPENKDVLVQLVILPVTDRSGNVIGIIIAGDNLNKNQHLPYQQHQVFGKTIDMLVTQMGERIASTASERRWLMLTLESNVIKTLKNGFSFQGATVLNDNRYEMFAEPIHNHKGEFVGSIAVLVGANLFTGIWQDNFINLLICGLLSSIVIFVLAYFTAWQFTAPIKRFIDAVKAVEIGDYSIRVPETGGLEFKALAEIFNRMTAALSGRDQIIVNQNSELTLLNEELEKRISERARQLEDEIVLQKSIIKSLVDGLVVADDHYRIITMNPVAEKLFGVRAADVIGVPLLNISEKSGFGELAALLRRSSEFPLSKEESVAIIKHNRSRIRFALTDLRDEKGSGRGVLLGIRDVTTDAEVDRLKSGFIAKISHELKTPLTSMKGSLQFILKKGKWLTGMEREMLGVCHRNTDRLIALIAGILELSRIEAGQVLFLMRPQQLAEVVLYAIEEIKEAALLKNISIVNEVPMDLPKVYGDYERLTQVLLNLLSNAVKFSPEDAVVTLSAAVEEPFLALSVADGAKTISEELRDSLFSTFQQMGSPEDGEFCGSGLGLAISKEIIERHGGSISYAPGASEGNIFTFRVPLYGEPNDKEPDTHCG